MEMGGREIGHERLADPYLGGLSSKSASTFLSYGSGLATLIRCGVAFQVNLTSAYSSSSSDRSLSFWYTQRWRTAFG